jgi:HrpA-like RNA helicase
VLLLLQVDFVLTLMRRAVAQRPDLKLLLMSATLAGDNITKYYTSRAAGNWLMYEAYA